MCTLEKKIGKWERKYKKPIDNSQICFKANWVLFVHCIGGCEMVSVGCTLSQCDSVVPLPLELVCNPWELVQAKPIPHLPSPGSV